MGYRLQAKECIFDYHIRYRSSFSLTQAISQLPTHLRLLPLDTLAEPALDKFNSGRPCNLSSSPGVSKPHGHCIFLTGRPAPPFSFEAHESRSPVPGSCTAEIAKVFVDHGVGLTCVGGRTQFEEPRQKIAEHVGEVGVVLGYGVVLGVARTGSSLLLPVRIATSWQEFMRSDSPYWSASDFRLVQSESILRTRDYPEEWSNLLRNNMASGIIVDNGRVVFDHGHISGSLSIVIRPSRSAQRLPHRTKFELNHHSSHVYHVGM
ncbi:hypothetical protein An16g05820 [Aspergillus niger]|uniref:Uncharacterized protein n=3 Tax=Aspergillus TaxID=5052 RepID=A2R848_ASPNC|nr:hypothetical protein An16g05820 [Aspergillus niger]CAK46922.1 hypothetical protein An16g05820 [Aspergillus niger]